MPFNIGSGNEQALVCLSNREKSTRAEGGHFIATWRITVSLLIVSA